MPADPNMSIEIGDSKKWKKEIEGAKLVGPIPGARMHGGAGAGSDSAEEADKTPKRTSVWHDKTRLSPEDAVARLAKAVSKDTNTEQEAGSDVIKDTLGNFAGKVANETGKQALSKAVGAVIGAVTTGAAATLGSLVGERVGEQEERSAELKENASEAAAAEGISKAAEALERAADRLAQGDTQIGASKTERTQAQSQTGAGLAPGTNAETGGMGERKSEVVSDNERLNVVQEQLEQLAVREPKTKEILDEIDRLQGLRTKARQRLGQVTSMFPGISQEMAAIQDDEDYSVAMKRIAVNHEGLDGKFNEIRLMPGLSDEDRTEGIEFVKQYYDDASWAMQLAWLIANNQSETPEANRLRNLVTYAALGEPPVAALQLKAFNYMRRDGVTENRPGPASIFGEFGKTPGSDPEKEIGGHDARFFNIKTIKEWGLPGALWVRKALAWEAIDTCKVLNEIAITGKSDYEGAFLEALKSGQMDPEKRDQFIEGCLPFVKLCSDAPRKISDLTGSREAPGKLALYGVSEVRTAAFLLRPENQKARKMLALYYHLGGYQQPVGYGKPGELITEAEIKLLNREMDAHVLVDPKDPGGPRKIERKKIVDRFRELVTATKSQEMDEQKRGLDEIAREVGRIVGGEGGDKDDFGLARWAMEYYMIFGEPGLNYDVGRMVKMHGKLLNPSMKQNGRLVGDGMSSFLGFVDNKGSSITEDDSERLGVLQRGLNYNGVTLAESLAKKGVVGLLETTNRLGVSKLPGSWQNQADILSALDVASNMINRKDTAYKSMPVNQLAGEIKKAIDPLRKAQPFTLVSDATYRRILSTRFASFQLIDNSQSHQRELIQEVQAIQRSSNTKGLEAELGGILYILENSWIGKLVRLISRR